MAVNMQTLDAATHVPVFKKSQDGGLIDLHFDVVTIDGETYYQPVKPGRRADNGNPQFGKIAPPIILDFHVEFPVPARPSEGRGRGQYGTWFYGGR